MDYLVHPCSQMIGSTLSWLQRLERGGTHLRSGFFSIDVAYGWIGKALSKSGWEVCHPNDMSVHIILIPGDCSMTLGHLLSDIVCEVAMLLRGVFSVNICRNASVRFALRTPSLVLQRESRYFPVDCGWPCLPLIPWFALVGIAMGTEQQSRSRD